MSIDHPANVSNALSRYKGEVVHLTHTDLDAVCSDAILRRRYSDVLTIYSSVQDFEAYLCRLAASDRRVACLYLSDLGGHPSAVDALEPLRVKGWHIEWRDHHMWDENTLTRARQIVDYLRVDPRFCACEIVYQDLLPDDSVAREIAAIGRDRDFWINKDPRSEMLSTVVHDNAWRERVAKNLSKGTFWDKRLQQEYETQTQKKQKSIERALEHSRTIDHVAITVSNQYASDIAALLRQKHGSTIEIILRTSGIFSIRSTAPISNSIAALFGGGGHPHAAGGNLNFSIVDRILFRLYKFRLKKVHELIRTALTYA